MNDFVLIIGALIIFVLWSYIFRRWQRGLYGLLLYLPFGGVVTLALHPSPLPTLFKDIFFVIPAYLSFVVSSESRKAWAEFPRAVAGAMFLLTAVVVAQMFNPDVISWMVAAIGAKVWLLYLPISVLAFGMIDSRADLNNILRLMVVLVCLPCTVGVVQWIGSMSSGYQVTMEAFYGEAARGATQNFASFDIGGNLYRIPSTFVFVTQYFGYTLAMIAPAYALARTDPSPVWRRFSNFTLIFVILSSFLSGARSAFVFVPLLLALIYLFDGRTAGVTRLAIIVTVPFAGALYISQLDPGALYAQMSELTITYADEVAHRGLVHAIQAAPLGMGTGMNTGPARYAFNDPQSFVAIENYYAKAVYELGIAGLVIVVGLFLTIIIHGYKIHRHIRSEPMKSVSATILAFCITISLSSFKGWQIDLDPINVYFWMFAGILLKLQHLDPLYVESSGGGRAVMHSNPPMHS